MSLDAAGSSVRDCALRLAAAFGPAAPVGRMTDVLERVRNRDGGVVTLAVERLESARDPLGVAGAVARRRGSYGCCTR
ncbi:hypothetical protein [Actinomadura sp. HBU206391]|uniref:hypothetical protein n=1 Tax=Actinomadura sp. HBU206391 TaxID=2731692 RepID=UPI001C9BFAA4|nr:hypothetical protein [Actinomadura sp. HBU206391]